jgi:hypothetical protein
MEGPMRAPIEYLEAAKAEEVARQLEADGYTVLKDAKSNGMVYDLVATKNGQKIAVEVKARSALRGAASQIRALREQAFRQGFDEFRLVVTNPPHETRVEIDGLDDQLLRHLAADPPDPPGFESLVTRVARVSAIEIDAINASAGAMRVVGTGVVEVALDPTHGPRDDQGSWKTDFPFSFDVTLDRDLALKAVNKLDIDMSSFND